MKASTPARSSLALAVALAAPTVLAQPESPAGAIAAGTASGSFNLRYEGVDEDNALADADALTIRSALKFTSAGWNGFSAMAELEDVRAVGLDDYAVPPTGFQSGQYSVIADPETTEVNQAYLQYARGGLRVRAGRQDIRMDNQRFIGAVPWRQDFQTFDALGIDYAHENGVNYKLSYHYLGKRNRIFAEEADIDSNDHLLHGNVKTPAGLLTGYGYLLEEDEGPDNALDTWGLRLSGSKPVLDRDVSYVVEVATQDYERGAVSFDADYYLLEVGTAFGRVNATLGFESLGSDGGLYGFATPLATLHAFQGWADVFLATPGQGIEDAYLNLSTAVFGGTATLVYHDFSAEQAGALADDLGSEVDLQWTRAFGGHYNFGIKFADYSQGDLAAKADKRVLWSWLTFSF